MYNFLFTFYKQAENEKFESNFANAKNTFFYIKFL